MKTVYTPFLPNDIEAGLDYRVAIDGPLLASWLDLSASLSTLDDANPQSLSTASTGQHQTAPTGQPQSSNL